MNKQEAKGYRPIEKRKKYSLIEKQLRDDRDSFRNYWRDLSKYILPRRSRFFITDTKRGDRRNFDIIDSTASLASRTLASGMMTGITSPARSWFNLAPSIKELETDANTKDYFKKVTEMMRIAFLRSNLYNILPTTYGDMGTFATGCIFMEEDAEDIVRFTSFPIGSYMIANDAKGRVRVFFREFQMSVRQIVEKFGNPVFGKEKMIDWSNISEHVRNQYENGNTESMVSVGHMVLPNDDYRVGAIESKYKKFSSVYYELGSSSTSTSSASTTAYGDKFLSEKGFDFFPVLAPRWEVVGEDTYGTNAPGMVCLGDVRQLQFGEKRIASAIDQKVKPSMVGPTSLKSQKASILPGDITYLDEREGTKGFRRLFEIDFDTRELEGKQDQIRQRISRSYYEDLFLMLAQSDRRQITAREIEERHEEKLLALGPVLERINQDLLDPLIENTFAIMDKQGLLPDAPEQLQGQEYKVEYVSIMAQAQKLAGIGSIERFTGFVGQMAGLDPSIVNKLNLEEAVEVYGDLTGVPQNLITSKEDMEAIKAQQAQQAQAEQQAMEQQQAIDASKTLSETKMDEGTALDELMGAVSE
jgi:hypothetical protein